jgi:hypothetical protein
MSTKAGKLIPAGLIDVAASVRRDPTEQEFEGDASLEQAPLRLSAMDALEIVKRQTSDWLGRSRVRRRIRR